LKEVIICLIKDDITNARLISGLQALGITADNYILHTSDVIFELSGIDSSHLSEEIQRGYYSLINRHICEPKLGVDRFAESMYNYLCSFSPKTIVHH